MWFVCLCMAFPSSTQYMKGPTSKVCSSRCGYGSQPCMVSHTWFISCSYRARTFEHTTVQCILHRHVYEYMQADNAHSYTHSPTLAHEHSHKHSQIKTRNQCNLQFLQGWFECVWQAKSNSCSRADRPDMSLALPAPQLCMAQCFPRT